MDIKIKNLFDSEKGKAIYSKICGTLKTYKMTEKLCDGVLVGLSGGADSVMLLCFLYEYRKRNSYFPITAVHINHMIRGATADRDEKFSSTLCNCLGIEFISRKIDVPKLAKMQKKSIEECARDVRYCEFSEIISGRADLNRIVVAHNANDNLETVLFNILRGAGTKGAAGIPPVREKILRPLIEVDKNHILDALESSGIPYVTDETNCELDYKRNYIRGKIVPLLYEICDNPVAMAQRFSSNLRSDEEYISKQADNIIGDADNISNEILRNLHPAVRARVLAKLAGVCGADMPSVAINSISVLLEKDNFSVSLPGNCSFVCQYGICSVKKNEALYANEFSFDLSEGKNEFDEFDCDFFLSDAKILKEDINIYNFFIQRQLSSVIINGKLKIRSRKDGDVIYYGGITRKVKTLFSDLKIPRELRGLIPILCDDSGIVWIPGLGVRDDGVDNNSAPFVALGIGKGEQLSSLRFYAASEFKKK